MMIEFHNTIIADVAVRAPGSPENVASLTELEFEYNR